MLPSVGLGGLHLTIQTLQVYARKQLRHSDEDSDEDSACLPELLFP